MSAHNAPFELHADSIRMVDPGDAGTITIDRNPAYVPLRSAGAEARTLGRPTKPGIIALLYMEDDGGDITLTVTGGYDEEGNTSLTFDDVGEFYLFMSGFDNDNDVFQWRMISNHELGNLSPDTLALVDDIDATAAEINQAADVSAMFEVVTGANVLTAAENGKTFFLNSATGFATTLPDPALGLRFKFIIGATPPTSGNHTIVATANIIKGGLSGAEVDDTADFDTSTADDQINFVANQAASGDWAEIYSDGTNWYGRGWSAARANLTLTQET